MVNTVSENNNLNPNGLILPEYIVLRSEGVFIKINPPPDQKILEAFIDHLFSSDNYFEGLNYTNLINLLYGDPNLTPDDDKSEVLVAKRILTLTPERKNLYREVKIKGNAEQAEYMFEQVFLEEVKDEINYGETATNGVTPNVEIQNDIKSRSTQLDFDEFVTCMWNKGVRFGIDADAVISVINKGSTIRMGIAFQHEPTDSKDAEIVEETDLLRQDNAPLILSNGKADLQRAKNRFPQVAKNVPLLRKIPRVLGQLGHRVNGTLIDPRLPEDLDLGKLASAGTHIEHSSIGDLLVSSIDGFIIIDEVSGAISVTEKIENKSGISAKATGNIHLTAEEYIEHGEVQEGRIVEGKQLTFLADVFGTVISNGGDISIKSRLSGGNAKCVGGNISVKGKTLNAILEAWDGKISVEFVENSLLMGKSVTVGRAVNCEIVAETLELGITEGCAIAGKMIQIISSTAYRNRESIVAVLLPDVASYDRQIAEARSGIQKIEQAIQAKNKEISATQSNPKFARYMDLAAKVRTGEIKFTPEQKIEWDKIVNQFAPIVRGTEGLMKKCIQLEDSIDQLLRERETCSAGEYCNIERLLGDTLIRKIHSNGGMSLLRNSTKQELKTRLHEFGKEEDRLLTANNGNFDWHFITPELPK